MKIEFDYKKSIQALNFFANKEGGQIDKLKVVKLIWLADRWHLIKYGRPISNDTYYAMEYGPVGSAIKDLAGIDIYEGIEKEYLKKFLERGSSKYNIKSVSPIDKDVLSETDIEAFETIYKEYGRYLPFELVEISHKFPEWKKFEVPLENGRTTRELMQYDDFFENVPDTIVLENGNSVKNIFAEIAKKSEATKKIFEERFQVANFWVELN